MRGSALDRFSPSSSLQFDSALTTVLWCGVLWVLEFLEECRSSEEILKHSNLFLITRSTVSFCVAFMGVPDNMLHKEISVVVSSSHSEGGSRRVLAENRHVGLAPIFKQRTVPAIWDFLLGCGKMAAPITRPSEKATID
ncbi:hypothetical protein J1N35_011314 [Gossypium stocksii]|uniref:Uncharacterized protein n=1 Tax=Gossypium stocksii TaxID=47602 RepID=A0A9D3W248_9ROSI|nr:hypothetical protein J1N35_011314 [Gossypium stocksii]